MEKKIDKDIIDFLKESNAIEREYSKQALTDATKAWRHAVKYYPMPISVEYVLKIHEILMKNLRPDIAGELRRCPVWVGGRECKFIDQTVIKNDLDRWGESNLSFRLSNDKAMELICKKSHIEFEKIHPFLDGNGRVGRIIMNVMRLDWKLPLLIIREGHSQFEYYKWWRDDG